MKIFFWSFCFWLFVLWQHQQHASADTIIISRITCKKAATGIDTFTTSAFGALGGIIAGKLAQEEFTKIMFFSRKLNDTKVKVTKDP